MKLSIHLLTIFLTILLFNGCKAQTSVISTTNEELDIYLKAKLMKVDGLGQIYLVNLDNELIKYDGKGKIIHSYSNNVLGELAQVDVTNPLKLILFYPDHQLVISLDNTLSEIGRYDLQSFGYNDVKVVALSNDNNLWIYDPEEFSLKKIDEQGNLELESYSLISENLGSLNPTSLKERLNKVYFNDPQKGVLVFDNFGQFIRIIPIVGVIEFQVESGGLVYFDGKAIYRYDSFLFESHRITEFEEWLPKAISVQIKKGNIYILLQDGLKVINR